MNMVRCESLPKLWGEWLGRCQTLRQENRDHSARLRKTGPEGGWVVPDGAEGKDWGPHPKKPWSAGDWA